jgi:hypothetical protein
LGDVFDDSTVRRGGAAEDRHAAVAEVGDEPADAAVVRPKVVTPIRDAVHFVDDDQAGAATENRHGLAGELGIGKTLR